jgi:hypothetical protein
MGEVEEFTSLAPSQRRANAERERSKPPCNLTVSFSPIGEGPAERGFGSRSYWVCRAVYLPRGSPPRESADRTLARHGRTGKDPAPGGQGRAGPFFAYFASLGERAGISRHESLRSRQVRVASQFQFGMATTGEVRAPGRPRRAPRSCRIEPRVMSAVHPAALLLIRGSPPLRRRMIVSDGITCAMQVQCPKCRVIAAVGTTQWFFDGRNACRELEGTVLATRGTTSCAPF